MQLEPMSHFDAQAFQEREELVNRMVEGRATFVKRLQAAAAAHHSTGSARERERADLMHQATLESWTHRSTFGPLHHFLQLGCEVQKAVRKAFGGKKGSS